MPSEFEIKQLLEITSEEKYATTVAAFEVVDLIHQIEVPKEYENRKPAIKAMQILADKGVQYAFISDEKRDEHYQELGEGEGDEMLEYAQPTAADVAEQICTPISNEEATRQEREQDEKDAQMLAEEGLASE
jgi:hypothetical protein